MICRLKLVFELEMNHALSMIQKKKKKNNIERNVTDIYVKCTYVQPNLLIYFREKYIQYKL